MKQYLLVLSSLFILSSCQKPLAVFHWARKDIKYIPKQNGGYGKPSHRSYSYFICFNEKCRKKSAWLHDQKHTTINSKKRKFKKTYTPQKHIIIEKEPILFPHIIDSNYVTSTNAHIIYLPKDSLQSMVGIYESKEPCHLVSIYLHNDILYFDWQTSKTTLAVLDNGQFLLLGTTAEHIIRRKNDSIPSIEFIGSELVLRQISHKEE